MSDHLLRQTACDWCYEIGTGDDAAAYYRRLREIGFTGVEMPDPGNWAAARAAGLELVNVEGPGMEWGLNRRDEHDAIVAAITETIDVAAANAIASVVVFSGSRRGIPDDEGIESCIAGLTRVAPVAERAGVSLLMELLNSIEHVDYHADSSRYAFEVVRAVASPAVSVLYDAYHMHRMGEDVIGDITANVDLIGHLHIAGSPRRDFPGEQQDIDYPVLIGEALAAGYRGAWGHEFLPSADPLDELGRAFSLVERAASSSAGNGD